jgi:hypothetical protein
MYLDDSFVTVADAFRFANIIDFVFASLCAVRAVAFG